MDTLQLDTKLHTVRLHTVQLRTVRLHTVHLYTAKCAPFICTPFVYTPFICTQKDAHRLFAHRSFVHRKMRTVQLRTVRLHTVAASTHQTLTYPFFLFTIGKSFMDTRTPRGESAGYVGLLVWRTGLPTKTPPDAYTDSWGEDQERDRPNCAHTRSDTMIFPDRTQTRSDTDPIGKATILHTLRPAAARFVSPPLLHTKAGVHQINRTYFRSIAYFHSSNYRSNLYRK